MKSWPFVSSVTHCLQGTIQAVQVVCSDAWHRALVTVTAHSHSLKERLLRLERRSRSQTWHLRRRTQWSLLSLPHSLTASTPSGNLKRNIRYRAVFAPFPGMTHQLGVSKRRLRPRDIFTSCGKGCAAKLHSPCLGCAIPGRVCREHNSPPKPSSRESLRGENSNPHRYASANLRPA